MTTSRLTGAVEWRCDVQCLRHPAMLNQQRWHHTCTTPGFGLTAGTGLRFARRAELEQGPETMAAARPAAARPR